MAFAWDAVFDPEPVAWGLRGDRPVWQRMAAALEGHPVPTDVADRYQLLRGVFLAVTDTALPCPVDPTRMRLTAVIDEGPGMSAGWVSLRWWMETGMPLLAERAGCFDTHAE
ncbi:hypothetical protein [Jannaschia pohangensis]|uniref:Uncharacterized protein n=1 Tax=Jannaschia pohangensis TaxID=390807 RepID=A0A1I3S1P3_9RHOB|nr:hypothetical protein [Jannaschia pohangensis]SFJ51499.1 hypothetical protein SAMN04488095_2948 [Jannaschia pohangensis]